ncbi:MAG: AAC(3) family N-acetyltransferase [Ruminococcaceae bacterium]|nr:AAC(3) family N-acetyltransferase [Oscillospiraceae bacterium]
MIHEKMAEDLRKLGIRSDDTILMHSSLSSLGYVEGGAETVIDTLLHVLSDGTLLVPALSFATVTAAAPNFSAKDTPSCVGAISEYFRKRHGVMRSLHPTHSVCGIGKNAAEMLRHHLETDTPVGAGSPFALLPKYGGKVLMLGCGLSPNTSMHGVEELSKPWYLLTKAPMTYQLTDTDGKTFSKSYYCHNFHASKAGQRYKRLADVMEIPSGKVLQATAHLIDAKTMWEVGDGLLRENANYFIDILE